jgi:hypothetical protein
MMTTGPQHQQPLAGYNYRDYVPTEGMVCPICDVSCSSLQNLNRVNTKNMSNKQDQPTNPYSI